MIMNTLVNMDCMLYMKQMRDNSVDFTLTDIPYCAVNRKDNGLRSLDKGKADDKTFDLIPFLESVYRVTKGSICVFCGKEQFSVIFNWFNKEHGKEGTVRQLIWAKSNPSPMNGDYIYLSATENAVWFKKKGATFNAHCKKNVFNFPCGKHVIHPTQKNLELFKDLILDNTNNGDLVFDPCSGGGTTALACKLIDRNFVGCELDKDFYEKSLAYLKECKVKA